jgi:ferrochelatase
MNKKIAVVLFNLGGPDSLSSVKKFLFNLFYDPAIIPLIKPLRWILAKYISSKRNKKAMGIYAQMGGGSTILPLTKNQAELLEKELNKTKKETFKVFISMRYWHPFANEVIKDMEDFTPDEIVFLPLYPQYSTTTTKSSFEEFYMLIKKSVLKNTNIKEICCSYKEANFIKTHVNLIKKQIKKVTGKYRILFSAHGLPEYVIKAGDPYQWQIEQTSSKIMEEFSKVDYRICYQSKVGSLRWLGPSTEEELEIAAKEDISVIVVPIAFVSDHSETLVELDIDYKNLFEKITKVGKYLRVPALNDNQDYILSLVNQVRLENIIEKCPEEFCKCPRRN